jgi:hypothetical protein
MAHTPSVSSSSGYTNGRSLAFLEAYDLQNTLVLGSPVSFTDNR